MIHILFKIPDVYKRLGYNEGINLVLWIIVISLSLFCFIFFLRLADKIKARDREGKRGFLAYSFFFLAVGLYRLLGIIGFMYADYYDSLISTTYIILLLACIFWIYVLETDMLKRKKRLITTISVTIFIIALLLLLTNLIDRYLIMVFISILWGFIVNLILLFYIIIAKRTKGIIQKKTMYLLIGNALLHLGLLLNAEFNMIWLPTALFFIPPLLFIIGITIFATSQVIYKIDSYYPTDRFSIKKNE